MNELPQLPDFDNFEFIDVIRSLKTGKAPGPDGIPNEAIKHCDNQTLNIYKNEMN